MAKFKVWIGLTLAISFTVLSISGLLSFFNPYNRTTATIHSVFGFLFVLSVLPHIWNNMASLIAYIRKKPKPS
jgi:hypothetical protein